MKALGKYKVVKGEDGKYKLTKNDVKSLNTTRPVVDIDKDALDQRIKKEKQC